MSNPYDKERLDEIFEEGSGGVTPVMWVALAFFGALALAIILLIDPRGDSPVPPAMQTARDQAKSGQADFRKVESGRSKSTPAETTGAAPREEVERRWPQEIEP